jgi:hypothetical protein
MPHCLPTAQAIEHAFKNETVGLVTREQFVEKRLTIEDRLKEEDKRQRHEAEEEEARVSRAAACIEGRCRADRAGKTSGSACMGEGACWQPAASY